MASYQGEIFDADNHYYEAHDAFTRHVPRRMQHRCVEWVELENGRKYQLVGGKIDRSGNPTFNPISKPGVLREYFSGNPRGMTSAELIRSAASRVSSSADCLLDYTRGARVAPLGLLCGKRSRV